MEISMNMIRKLTIGLIILLWLPVLASADEYKEGVNYRRLATPVPTSTGDKIEVVEVFWYGCPHCYDLEPLIQTWLKHKPDNVEFHHLPAALGRRWEPLARAFYTAQILGVLDKIHQPLFDAIHAEGRPLNDEQQIAEFFAEHGVDKETFHKTYNSFDVELQLRRAQHLVQSYGIFGVPAMVVNGKYVTDGNMAGSKDDILKVVNFLIAKESKDA
jgi:thiol:disulfide interchange protein DsbA